MQDYYTINYILPLLGFAITALAQLYIKANYSKYKQKSINKNITGYEVARKILDTNDLHNVKINKVAGELTDHYDPSKKVVNLSEDIYEGKNIAAASVAAHECGHAIQDKVGYIPLRIRAALVPIVNFSTKIGYLVVVIGLIFNAINLATIGLILLLSMLAFQLITLPVEFNASIRAEKQLKKLNLLEPKEQSGSKKMLISAALTYVAGMLSTLLQILRLAMIVLSRRNNRR